MLNKKTVHSLTLSSKAQEMLMRDVLDGMEDFVGRMGFHNSPCEFEIVPIARNAVAPENKTQGKETDGKTTRAEVISYSEKKQKLSLKLSA